MWTPDGASPPDADAERGGALAKAYARWRLPLLRGLARFKGSISSAEDALHDGVVKWAAANPALRSTDEHGAYLRKTVLNGVADEFRERQAGRQVQAMTLEDAGAEGWATGAEACPMRTAAHRQRLERLSDALQELPERQREAFVLNRFDGLTQDESPSAWAFHAGWSSSTWRARSLIAKCACTMLRLRKWPSTTAHPAWAMGRTTRTIATPLPHDPRCYLFPCRQYRPARNRRRMAGAAPGRELVGRG
ncbi:RNA polymerase sigma factor [Achromobacter marplatensis]|uniref:RNA polymerase sigma factor n=1 Tax=Achromobacter marplatensis TaxID=470868 RepID=UPI003C72C904